MKCPGCGYVDWRENRDNSIGDGDRGDFYEVTAVATSGDGYDKHIEEIHACPRCGTVFIDKNCSKGDE